MASHSPPISKINAGGGRIKLALHGKNATLSELSATYPLKLLSPRISQDGVAIVYALTYGGGLVGGDTIDLEVEIGHRGKLLLLTQGSTKVFKTRLDQRMASVHKLPSKVQQLPASTSSSYPSPVTTQKLNFVVLSEGALFLLPDPVTCFRAASYHQIQTFCLALDASLIVLDWLTSGRKSLGEEWALSRYYSVNEVKLEGQTIVKDVMLLEDGETPLKSLPNRTLRDKLAPYSCYATVILYGPLVQRTITNLTQQYKHISVMKLNAPDDLLWSLSPIGSEPRKLGAIVRVAGKETETVQGWLRRALLDLEGIVGIDVYRRAFV